MAQTIDITVLDKRDNYGYLNAYYLKGEIYMTSAVDMVSNVRKKAGAQKIRALRIIDHGNIDHFELGDDKLDLLGVYRLLPLLRLLQPLFAPKGAYVFLEHCLVGNNDAMMKLLAKYAFGVTVIATPFTYVAYARMNEGGYLRAFHPDGTVTKITTKANAPDSVPF